MDDGDKYKKGKKITLFARVTQYLPLTDCPF